MHLGCKAWVGGAARRGIYTEDFVPANYTGPVTFAGYYPWETPLQVVNGVGFTCQDPYLAGPAAQMLYRPFKHFVETEGMFRIGTALQGNYANATLFFSPDATAIVDPTTLAVATNGLSISVITNSTGSYLIASKLALGNKNTGYVSGAFHGNKTYNVVTTYDVYYKITATMLYASLVEKDAAKPGTWELSLACDPMQIAHHGIIATCRSTNNIYGPAVVNVTKHVMAQIAERGSRPCPALGSGSSGGGIAFFLTYAGGLNNLGTIRASGGALPVAASYGRGGPGGAGSVNTFQITT